MSRRRSRRYFQPIEEQRRIVAILSGFCVNQDEICKLIPGCDGNKRISKITLHRHFKAELETGNVTLKELIARKFVDALEAGEGWAIRLGLKNKMKWAIGDNATLPPEMLFEGTGEPEMRINFVLPSRKEEPPVVDVSPQPEPDYSRPALPPPRERKVDTPFGTWRTSDPNGWMK
jgi:hypothetical protein